MADIAENIKPVAQMAITRDGTKISYALHPGAAKARFVLVHSLAMDKNFWNYTLPYLQKSGEVLTYDCRGHGLSDKPPGPYDCDGFADDLADLLNHVGWARAVVAGASMGGCVSIAFAGRYPAMVSGLGLIDTTAWYGPDAPSQWEERAQKAISQGLQDLVKFQKSRWVSEGFLQKNQKIVDEAIEVFLANKPEPYAQACRMLGRFDGRAYLQHIKCPTVVVVGEEDYAAPVAMAQASHAAIAGSSLHILPGVRHLTPLECPEIIAEKLHEIAFHLA